MRARADGVGKGRKKEKGEKAIRGSGRRKGRRKRGRERGRKEGRERRLREGETGREGEEKEKALPLLSVFNNGRERNLTLATAITY